MANLNLCRVEKYYIQRNAGYGYPIFLYISKPFSQAAIMFYMGLLAVVCELLGSKQVQMQGGSDVHLDYINVFPLQLFICPAQAEGTSHRKKKQFAYLF